MTDIFQLFSLSLSLSLSLSPHKGLCFLKERGGKNLNQKKDECCYICYFGLVCARARASALGQVLATA